MIFFALVRRFLSKTFLLFSKSGLYKLCSRRLSKLNYRCTRLFAFAKPLAARGQGRPPACLATINGILNRTRGPIVLNARNVTSIATQVREESIVSKRTVVSTYESVNLKPHSNGTISACCFPGNRENKAGSSLTRQLERN